MLHRAIVTPIATETGASVPSGASDDENEARNRNNSSNNFWKNRRSHNPGSVPIPLLGATAPRRKGHRRRRRDRLYDSDTGSCWKRTAQPCSSNTSVESGSVVSPRILAAMLLIMVVCVLLEVILVDCFFFGDNNHILRASTTGGSGGKNANSSLLLIPNNSHSTVHPKLTQMSDAVSESIIPPPSIASATTSTSSTTDRNLRHDGHRYGHGHRRPRIRQDTLSPLPLLT
jgi:hypothetical protein